MLALSSTVPLGIALGLFACEVLAYRLAWLPLQMLLIVDAAALVVTGIRPRTQTYRISSLLALSLRSYCLLVVGYLDDSALAFISHEADLPFSVSPGH